MKTFLLLATLLAGIAFGGHAVSASSERNHDVFRGKSPVRVSKGEYVVLGSGDTMYFLCVVEPGSGNSWKVESFGLEAGAAYCSPIGESPSAPLSRVAPGSIPGDWEPVHVSEDEYVLLEPGDVVYFLCIVAPGSGNSWKVESFGLEAGAVHCSPID